MSSKEDYTLDQARDEIYKMRLSRLIVFGDVLSRYFSLKVKEYRGWVKVHALLFLITRGENITPSDLAKIMLRSKNSITDLMNAMEKEKLIKREHSKQDRRKITIKITSKGIKFAIDRLRRLTTFEEEFKNYIDENEFSTLVSLVRNLRRKMIENLTGMKSERIN